MGSIFCRSGTITGMGRIEVPRKLRWEIYKRDGYQCLFCGSLEDLSLDHVRRVCDGGDNSPENLRTLCRRCNSKRGRTSDAAVKYDPRRPRVPTEVASRVDGVRGQVPFNRWVVRALEAALDNERGPSSITPEVWESKALTSQMYPDAPSKPRAASSLPAGVSKGTAGVEAPYRCRIESCNLRTTSPAASCGKHGGKVVPND